MAGGEGRGGEQDFKILGVYIGVLSIEGDQIKLASVWITSPMGESLSQSKVVGRAQSHSTRWNSPAGAMRFPTTHF